MQSINSCMFIYQWDSSVSIRFKAQYSLVLVHELAACFLAVASEELRIGYVGDACTCVIPEDARKHGGRHEILRRWDDLTKLRNLRPCYNIALEQVPVSSTPGWDRVRKTVAQVAAKECGEALEAVDDLMRNIDI